MKVPESFDLILEFESNTSREHFIQWIEDYFASASSSAKQNSPPLGNDETARSSMNEEDISLPLTSESNSTWQQCQLPKKRTVKILSGLTADILKDAETKERRQEKLDRFFREAYALSFGLK